MKKNICIILFSVLFCLVFILSLSETVGIHCKTDFDYNMIYEHIEQICKNGPHSIEETKENLAVMEYIVSQLEQYGVVNGNTAEKPAYILQDFIYEPPKSQNFYLKNIIVHIPANNGTPTNKAVMMMAHFDSVATGPGAGDDATGCSVMLETIRYYLNKMNNGYTISNDLVFCFVNGEEYGLLGSKAFIKDFDGFDNIVNRIGFAINFDSRGTSGAQIMYETSDNNYNTIKLFAGINENLYTSSAAARIYDMMPNGTDFSTFKNIYQGINIATLGNSEYYHTQDDSPENISKSSLLQQANIADDLIKNLANYNLDDLYQTNKSAVFFSYLNIGTVAYSNTTAVILAVTGLLLLVSNVILSAVYRKERKIKNTAKSFIAVVTGLILTGGVIYGCYYLFQIIAVAAGNIDIQTVGKIKICNTAINLGMIFLVLAVTALISFLSCRILKITNRDIIRAVAYIHVLLGIILSFLFVESSYFFIFSGILMMINELVITLTKKINISKYHFEMFITAIYMPVCIPAVFITEALGLKKAFITGMIFTISLFAAGTFIASVYKYFSLRTVISVLKKEKPKPAPVKGFLYLFAIPVIIFLCVSLTTPDPNANLDGKLPESTFTDDSLNYYICNVKSNESLYKKKYMYIVYDTYAYNALKKYASGLKQIEDYYECRAEKKEIGISVLSSSDKNVLTIKKADNKSKIRLLFMNSTAESFSVDDGITIKKININKGFSGIELYDNCTITLNGGSTHVIYQEIITDYPPIIPDEYKKSKDKLHFNLFFEEEYFLSE